MTKYFLKNGVYKLLSNNDSVFLCLPAATLVIGKLQQFKLIDDKKYEKTGNTYFLSSYKEDDVRSIFLNEENYEQVGLLDSNFILSEDGNVLIEA